MITAERKPLAEVIDYIDDCRRILLVGCNECVTVCAAGGRKEVATLASALQMDFMKRGKTVEIREMTLERQCEPEYVEQLAPFIDQVDAVLSMACGCGGAKSRIRSSPARQSRSNRRKASRQWESLRLIRHH
ncbi:MAG: hypothetical protein R6W95_18435, partial [Desulfosarcina sp.]